MSVELKPESMRFIGQLLRDGKYDSAESVVEAGLAMLEQQQLCGEFAPGELEKLLAEGEADIAAGRIVDGQAVFDRLRSMSAQRRADERR